MDHIKTPKVKSIPFSFSIFLLYVSNVWAESKVKKMIRHRSASKWQIAHTQLLISHRLYCATNSTLTLSRDAVSLSLSLSHQLRATFSQPLLPISPRKSVDLRQCVNQIMWAISFVLRCVCVFLNVSVRRGIFRVPEECECGQDGCDEESSESHLNTTETISHWQNYITNKHNNHIWLYTRRHYVSSQHVPKRKRPWNDITTLEVLILRLRCIHLVFAMRWRWMWNECELRQENRCCSAILRKISIRKLWAIIFSVAKKCIRMNCRLFQCYVLISIN